MSAQANLQRFEEIAKRGLQDKLPSDKRARFDEAVRRGLINLPSQNMNLSPRANEELSPQQLEQLESARQAQVSAVGAPEIAEGPTDATRRARVEETLTPEQLGLVQDISKPQAVLINVGKGMDDIRRVVTGEKRDPAVEKSLDVLRSVEPNASELGEIVGQSAPFLPAGVVASGAKTLTGRVLGNAAVGASEGAAVSMAEGESGTVGGIQGGIAAGALEVLVPYIGRVLSRKVTNLPENAIKPDGSLSEDAQKLLDDNGVNYEEVIKEAAEEQAQEASTEGIQSTIESAAKSELKPSDIRPNKERIEALESFGLNDAPIGAISDNKQVVSLAGGLASVPASLMSEERKTFVDKVAQAADGLILEMGGHSDMSQLSDNVLSTMKDTREGLYDVEKHIYDAVAAMVPNNRVNASSLSRYMRGIAEELGDESEMSALDKRILRISESNPKYALLDQLRKDIGASIGRTANAPYGNESTARLRDRYAKITELQERYIKEVNIGADVGQQWNVAKRLTQKRKDLEDNTVKLFGSEFSKSLVPEASRAVKGLGKGDFRRFDEMMAALPKTQKEMVAVTALQEVFKGRNGAFSPLEFNNWYNGLRNNKAAKTRLERYLPDNGKRLRDFYIGTKGVADMQREFIPNGRIRAMLDDFDKQGGMLDKLTRTGGKLAAAEGATTTMGIPGVGAAIVLAKESGKKKSTLEAASKLLSDPAFVNTIKLSAKNENQRLIDLAEERLKRSQNYRNWIKRQPKSVASTIGTVGLVGWLSSEDD